MNRRAKHLIGTVALIVVLFTPQLLSADEGFTLADLAERVETLFQGQSKLDSRVAAIETTLAPTPTKTIRPTATPNVTATVEAKETVAAKREVRPTATAEAQVTATARVKATATALARYRATRVALVNVESTATAKAQQSPTSVEMSVYRRGIEPILADLLEGLMGAARLLENPKFDDHVWNYQIDGYLGQIQSAWFIALSVDPPSSLSSVHEVFMQGLDECLDGANDALDGLTFLEPEKLESAESSFLKCSEFLEEASGMLNAMQR